MQEAKKVGLISCSKLKLDVRCEASILYSKSNLFKKASNYAEKNYDKWYILSAKYNLIKPDEMIDTYDLSLNNMNKRERMDWASTTFNMILMEIDSRTQVYFHCGEVYREYLIELLEKSGYEYYVPLQGLGIGQQLQFYKDRV
jgi:hypothetical protein